MENIYASVPGALKEELLEILLAAKGFRLERIVSKGHATPPGDWYDQETGEWVILLKGGAGLRFEGQEDVWVMKPGDYVLIPPHSRHRIEWTAEGETTVWLAFHYGAGGCV
jgi:cupin 2 domain-containing protein